MKSTEKILICYNKPMFSYSNYAGKSLGNISYSSETEIKDNLELIISNLSHYYSSIYTLEIDSDIISAIKKIKNISPDICFNLVESINGNAFFESSFAGILELLEINFTGNSSLTLANCLDKFISKQILISNNIPTPKYLVKKFIQNYIPNFNLTFPCILKPSKEDASIGISENSIVKSVDELYNQINYLTEVYKQDILIEEYIEGREFNISILDNKVLPISEIIFSLPNNLPSIVSYEAKWDENSLYYKNTTPQVPANITKEIEDLLTSTALNSYNALNCQNYARIDIRLSQNNIPYVIDINPNPDIMPFSGFANSALAAGISYSELLNYILTLSKKRDKND
jgi:D-alanine-D-alanine ligase